MTTTPRPITLDITGYDGAAVERTGPGEYWPVLNGQIISGQMFRSADEAEAVAIAAWVQAQEAAELALEERAAGYDSAAALAEAEWRAADAALSARCACYATGTEQPECLARGTSCDRPLFHSIEAMIAAGRPECDQLNPYDAPAPAPIGTATVLLRADHFDALCEGADAARGYWADVPRRLKVINDGWSWLLEQDTLFFTAVGELLYPSESEPGITHRVGVSCSCTAGRWGQHCKHAAAADIIGRARRIASGRKAA